ncbi:MAG: hypothetical protein AB4426_29570 [Xenococcaceae cyanobacterium]
MPLKTLTASILEEERSVVKEAGCDDFMPQPFREEDILRTMNKHLGVRYIYEDQTESDISTEDAQQSVLTASALAALPVEWVSR